MRSEMRHLLMRHRAYERRKRREEVQLVGIRNEIRSAFGGDPIDPYSSTSSVSQDTNKDAAARKELLKRVDFSDTEELSPEGMSDLTE